MDRLARGAVPHDHRLALVRDAERSDVRRFQLGQLQGLHRHRELRRPDFVGVVLDPTGRGKKLLEFPLSQRNDFAVRVEDNRAGRSRSLIEGQNIGHGGACRMRERRVAIDARSPDQTFYSIPIDDMPCGKLSCAQGAPSKHDRYSTKPRRMSLIIAHRGASADAPENTLAAFRLAWQQGADGIEGDFRLTSDGRIVCFHDDDTARVAGISLIVEETPLTKLRTLDVGAWKGKPWQGERIASLEEVLAEVPAGKQRCR